MKTRPWHLDIPFSDKLFSECWSSQSQTLLLELFRHLERSTNPVVSMLPSGVSAGGAAAAAALYFLPEVSAPPAPHCRIALYPGLHFIRQVEAVLFESRQVLDATRRARVKARYHGVVPAFDRISKRSSPGDHVHFHWMLRCQRRWTRHWSVEVKDLVPRAHYGRNDPYEPCIEIIESEDLEVFSNPATPYDLLIYCPYFHSPTTTQGNDNLELLLRKIEEFNAHRKLIVVRSPYSYWAKRLDGRFSQGIALSTVDVPAQQIDTQLGVNLIVVEQFLDLDDAYTLEEGLRRLTVRIGENQAGINEIKTILRQLLVSLDPAAYDFASSLGDVAERLVGLCEGLGLKNDQKAWAIVMQLRERITADPGRRAKLEKIRELASAESFEIWVTKDLDRTVISDFIRKHDLPLNVRIANRWMAPGQRHSDQKVILSRIDREADLDALAYLRSGDSVVLSTWEAVVRAPSIMRSWERSERWREEARKHGITKRSLVRYADPVLDLAHHLDKLVARRKGESLSPTAIDISEAQATWWDERETLSTLYTDLDRQTLLLADGGRTSKCLEVRFDGNMGMFVRADDHFQVVSDNGNGSDVTPIAISKLKRGMIVVLFKDSERSSFFDLLMDQLERSPEYQSDAKVVKNWKEQLRAHVLVNKLDVSAIGRAFTSSGRSFDPVTIREWIFGSTMAPLRHEHLRLLVEILRMGKLDVDVIFRSVERLRIIARLLGRALNQLILSKNMDDVEGKVRLALVNAGIDIEELTEAIETRSVLSISTSLIEVEDKHVRRLFVN